MGIKELADKEKIIYNFEYYNAKLFINKKELYNRPVQ